MMTAYCVHYTCLAFIMMAQWHSGKALDLQSVGRGFNSHHDKAAQQPWASCSHMCLCHQAV